MHRVNILVGWFHLWSLQSPVWSAFVVLPKKPSLSDCGLSWVIGIRYPQRLLPGEPRRPIQSKCFETRMLHTWNWESPGLITKSLFPCRLIRPSRCEPGGTVLSPVAFWVCGTVQLARVQPLPKALHMRSFESPNRWLFGKHLFGLEISRSSVNLPGPNPHLMECFVNIRQQYFCYFTSNDQKCQWFPLSFLWIMEKLTASLGCSWGRYLLTIL